MVDPTLVIVAEDVTETFMPLGVTDPKRASSRLVWPRGQVVRQGDIDAYSERNDGAKVETADVPERTVLTLGRIVDLDAGKRRSAEESLPTAKTAIAGSVPQNPDAPAVLAGGPEAVAAAEKALEGTDDASVAAATGSTGDDGGKAADAPDATTAGGAKSTTASSSSKGRSTTSKGSDKGDEAKS